MIFRDITLRKPDNGFITFEPENIQDITFKKDSVIIQYWRKPCPTVTVDVLLKKGDYNFTHWRYFINQLVRTFEIEEIEL